MLEKTMKQILTKKIDKWIGTIKDEKVVKATRKDLIITGGCFTSMLQNEEPNDYDCYFRTKETVIIVAEYYAKVWNSTHPNKIEVLDCDMITNREAYNLSPVDDNRVKMFFRSEGVVGNPEEANSNEELGVDSTLDLIEELDEVSADSIIAKEKKEYFPVFISSNAITLSNDIQIVCRFYGEPDEIHETYDFIHTRAYYDLGERELCVPKEVYEATLNKTLIYTGSKYPVCSVFRLRKFIGRGWKINAGQMLKMCMQISELDLLDIDILEDQLIGVDSLYFMNLIEMFRKRKASDPSFDLTSNYLISIIDKIF